MKKILMTIGFLAIVSRGYSQRKFDKEFIVTTKGDTVVGQVSISNRNFTHVKFIDVAGQSHSYTSAEIESFYDSEWGLYITSLVGLSISGINKEDVLHTEPTMIFLETIIQVNDLSIYYFRNAQQGPHYFIRKGAGPIDELILHVETAVVNGNDIAVKEERYKKTLANYLSDCPTLQDEIKKSALSEKSLQMLLAKYAACVSKTLGYKSPIDHGKWSLGVLAGWSTSAIDYETNAQLPPYSTPFTKSSSFTLGIAANYLISQRSKKFSLLNELMYRKLEASRAEDQNQLNYTIHYLRLNTLVRYNFVNPSILKPFLLVGMSNSFAVSTKAQETFPAGVPYKLDTRGYEQGLLLGVGINRKKIDVFGRLELSNGFAPPNGVEKTSVRSIYVGLAWWFN